MTREEWKPTLRRKRVNISSAEAASEIQNRERENERILRELITLGKVPDDGFTSIDDSIEEGSSETGSRTFFKSVEHNGKVYLVAPEKHRSWLENWQRQKPAQPEPIEEEEEEPFHFNEELVENMRNLRLFGPAGGNGIQVPSESTTDLAKLLYDDLEEIDETNSMDRSRQSDSRAFLAKKYRQFYANPMGEQEYDLDLDVTKSREAILSTIANYRVTIVEGATGTGKTTHVPLFILDDAASKGEDCRIVITQPRRLAAITNAKRVVSRRKMPSGASWKLGDLVGYHIGMDNHTSKQTRVTFATTAVFLKTISTLLDLKRFTHVILDEVHERDQDTDICLMLVKKMMEENSPDTKLIIMSATMDLEKIRKYFCVNAALEPHVVQLSDTHRKNIGILHLDDIWHIRSNQPIPEFFMEEPDIHQDVIQRTVSEIEDLHQLDKECNRGELGAVLIFLPGMSHIKYLQGILDSKCEKNKWEILLLHSTLNSETQDEVMRTPARTVRRIILSTNIAESSITIPYVVYVIDFGLTKRLILDPLLDIPRLSLQWTSRANMIQRKGRAGRVQNGMYFCMLPKNFHSQLPEYESPDIMTSPIDHSILHVKTLRLPSVWKPHHLFLQMLDCPTKESVDKGILRLKEVGALSLTVGGKFVKDNGELTPMGELLERLPVSLNLGRLLILSFAFGLLEDGIKIAAGMSVRNIFNTNFGTKTRDTIKSWYNKAVLYDGDSYSDSLAILQAFDNFSEATKFHIMEFTAFEKQWCEDNLLSHIRMREMVYLYLELRNRLEEIGLYDPVRAGLGVSPEHRKDLLKIILAGSFYPYYFLQDPIDLDRVHSDLPFTDPARSLVLTKIPIDQGPLYESQIRSMLDPYQTIRYIPPEIIYCEDKGYISFSRHLLTKSGKVPRQLRLAVHVRNRERSNCFSSVRPKEDYWQSVDHAREKHRSDRITTFFLAKKHCGRTPRIPDRPWPYSMEAETIIELTDVQNPNRLFIRANSLNSQMADLFRKLEEIRRGRNPPPILDDPQPGDYGVTPVEIGPKKWVLHRALVIDPERRLFLVDIGNYYTTNPKNIRQISDDLANVPAFAFEFAFARIQIREMMINMVKDYLMGLLTLAQKPVFKLKVYSYCHSVVRGELLVENIAPSVVNINEELITLGFAYPVRESMHSELAHQGNGISIVKYDVPASSNGFANQQTSVMGPYTQIAAKFNSIVSQWQQCEIRSVSDSINHQFFDGEPEKSYAAHQLLIASGIEKSSHSKRANTDIVNIQHSTLMPRHPGLLSILLTLFAPCVQLKYNKSVSAEGYTGAIAGVGFIPSKSFKKAIAIYPDHDMRVDFDAVLTPSDVDAIDDLRKMINDLVQRKDLRVNKCKELSNEERKKAAEDLLKLQKHCRRSLLDIINQPRTAYSFRENMTAYRYEWSLIEPKFQSSYSTNLGQQNQLLQPIYVCKFPNFENAKNKSAILYDLLKFHQEAVRHIWDKSADLMTDREKSYCPVCNLSFPNRLKTWLHANSFAHRNVVSNL